jgi:hypothetical protein
MLARSKQKPIATDGHPPGVAALQELSARIEELIRRNDALLAEQLALEGTGATPSEETKFDPNAEAKRLLNGAAGFAADVGMASPQRLSQVIKLRQAIASAIEIGRKREGEMRLALSAVLGAAQIEAWRKLVTAVEEHARALVQIDNEARALDMQYRAVTQCDPAQTGELGHSFALSEFAEAAREFLGRQDLALANMVQGRR